MSQKKYPDVKVGDNFGKLTVTEETNRRDKWGERFYLCLCSCGKERIVGRRKLVRHLTRTCGGKGCSSVTHGLSQTPEYQIWASMCSRCTNPNHQAFSNYGGRGITVCDQWLQSFEAFLADVGARPSDLHSLDRFPNNNGNYSPSNCRWATTTQQNRNTRMNVFLRHNGRSQTVSAWSEELEIDSTTIRARLKRGWSVERALTTLVDVRSAHVGK